MQDLSLTSLSLYTNNWRMTIAPYYNLLWKTVPITSSHGVQEFSGRIEGCSSSESDAVKHMRRLIIWAGNNIRVYQYDSSVLLLLRVFLSISGLITNAHVHFILMSKQIYINTYLKELTSHNFNISPYFICCPKPQLTNFLFIFQIILKFLLAFSI